MACIRSIFLITASRTNTLSELMAKGHNYATAPHIMLFSLNETALRSLMLLTEGNGETSLLNFFNVVSCSV